MSVKPKSRTIVAIGEGKIDSGETYAITREMVRLSKKKSPKLLYIPTASSDNVGYWNAFREYFQKRHACRPSALFLLHKRPPQAEIKKAI